MNKRAKKTKKPGDGEIDRIVVEQANDESAWEKQVHIRKAKRSSFSLPAELAARAAFLAQLHREPTLEDWLVRVVRERVELEELAFGQAKRDLTAKLPV